MEFNERDTRLTEKCDRCAGQGSVSGGKGQGVVDKTSGKPGDDGGDERWGGISVGVGREAGWDA